MHVFYKGAPEKVVSLQPLIDVLENALEPKYWEHHGLKVEIDPTVDYADETILVRWTDVDEGFNDKIIVHSLYEFESLFKPYR